jgi:hypothetical protein
MCVCVFEVNACSGREIKNTIAQTTPILDLCGGRLRGSRDGPFITVYLTPSSA